MLCYFNFSLLFFSPHILTQNKIGCKFTTFFSYMQARANFFEIKIIATLRKEQQFHLIKFAIFPR